MAGFGKLSGDPQWSAYLKRLGLVSGLLCWDNGSSGALLLLVPRLSGLGGIVVMGDAGRSDHAPSYRRQPTGGDHSLIVTRSRVGTTSAYNESLSEIR